MFFFFNFFYFYSYVYVVTHAHSFQPFGAQLQTLGVPPPSLELLHHVLAPEKQNLRKWGKLYEQAVTFVN